MLTALAALLAIPSPAAAAPGESQVPIANPDLDAACGIDILVILDESTSIANAGATNDVKTAFRAFTAALNNTGSRMAVAEFSSVARLPLSGAANRAYTTVTDASIASTFEPYINGFNPDGRTHWEDGFRVGRYFLPRQTQAVPHLTLFITDGNPNQMVREDQVTYDPGNPTVAQNEYELKVPLSDGEQTQSSENPATLRAVPNANALKATGSHVLAVAVGDGLSGSGTLDRLIAISDDDVFPDTGPFDISTTDIYREEDFSLLQDALREAAFQLCAPSVNIHKSVDENPDPGGRRSPARRGLEHEGDRRAGARGVGPAARSERPDGDGDDGRRRLRQLPVDDRGARRLDDHGDRGGAAGVRQRPVPPAPAAYITPDITTPTPMPDFVATDGGFSGTIPADAIVTCEMVNRVVPEPDIDLEKATNGHDSDTAPGRVDPDRPGGHVDLPSGEHRQRPAVRIDRRG